MSDAGDRLLYGGVALAGLGFVLIAVTWARVAGLDSVAEQIPYVVSGGMTGLGLVIVGVTAVNIHAKRREAAERDRQGELLVAILRQVSERLGGAPPADPAETKERTNRRSSVGAGTGSVVESECER